MGNQIWQLLQMYGKNFLKIRTVPPKSKWLHTLQDAVQITNGNVTITVFLNIPDCLKTNLILGEIARFW